MQASFHTPTILDGRYKTWTQICHAQQPDPRQLRNYLAFLQSNNPVNQLTGLIGIRKIFQNDLGIFQQDRQVSSDLIRQLIQALCLLSDSHYCPQIQLQSVLVANRLFFGRVCEHRRMIIQQGLLQKMAGLLQSPYDEIVEQACQFITAMAITCEDRHLAYQLNVVPLIVGYLRRYPDNGELVYHGQMALYSLCSRYSQVSYEPIREGVLYMCDRLAQQHEVDPFPDYISQSFLQVVAHNSKEIDIVDRILHSNLLSNIISNLASERCVRMASSLQAITSIIALKPAKIDLLLQLGIIQVLQKLLSDQALFKKLSFCNQLILRILSGLISKSPNTIPRLLTFILPQILVHFKYTDEQLMLKCKQVIIKLINTNITQKITKPTQQQIVRLFVKYHVIQSLLIFLQSSEDHSAPLDDLTAVLRFGEEVGQDNPFVKMVTRRNKRLFEQLLHHQDETISMKTMYIISSYLTDIY